MEPSWRYSVVTSRRLPDEPDTAAPAALPVSSASAPTIVSRLESRPSAASSGLSVYHQRELQQVTTAPDAALALGPRAADRPVVPAVRLVVDRVPHIPKCSAVVLDGAVEPADAAAYRRGVNRRWG